MITRGYRGLPGVKGGFTRVLRGCKRLQRVKAGYKGLQGINLVSKGYRRLQGLQGVRAGYKGLEEVTGS